MTLMLKVNKWSVNLNVFRSQIVKPKQIVESIHKIVGIGLFFFPE